MHSALVIYPDGRVTFELDSRRAITDTPFAVDRATAHDPQELGLAYDEREINGDDVIISFTSRRIPGFINLSDIKMILITRRLSDHPQPFSPESLSEAVQPPEQYFDYEPVESETKTST